MISGYGCVGGIAHSGGGGAAIAQALADAGAALVLADLATSKLVAVGQELVEQGHRVVTQAVDLVSENSVEELVSFAQKSFGRLDAVVNAAAATNLRSRSWGDGHGGRRLGSNVRGECSRCNVYL